MKILTKRGRKRVVMPDLPYPVVALVIKKYTEQALKNNGLSVDRLAYSDQLREIVNSVNEKGGLVSPITEKDVYSLLLFLRKTRRLPKLFRDYQEKIAA